jgi:acetyl-CoA acyltransferase
MPMSGEDVWIIGAAMTKIGRYSDRDVIDLGSEGALEALRDASLTIRDIDILAVGNARESNTSVAQRIQKQIGQTGIPAYNVFNACASGATAIRTVIMAVKSGEADIGLAIGAEQMVKTSRHEIAGAHRDITAFTPRGRHGSVLSGDGMLGVEPTPGVFAQAAMAYASKYGVTREQFAMVAEKNHRNSARNPYAQSRRVFSLDEILAADDIAYPNTVPMCSPPGDGAAALIIVSTARLAGIDPDVRRRAVKISASVLTTDPWTHDGQAQPDINTLTREAAGWAYELAGVGPEDLDLVELHDYVASAELLHYDDLGLCKPGRAGELIESGSVDRDGRTPVNVSGGLLSKGHPTGATGVANIYEIVAHLRGEAGDRQVDGAKVGLAHVVGLGSACSVHILEKATK